MTRVLLVGHGRMGKLIESLAAAHDCEIAGIVDERSTADAISSAAPSADVAIDFTIPDAVPVNLPKLAARRLNVVVGTTGWQAHEKSLRDIVGKSGIGVLASANFAIGVHIFRAAVEEAARRFATQADVGAWIHESHHVMKKDAPSGTALMLKSAMERAGYSRNIDVSSTRAGSIPGTHVAGFDGPADTLTLTHTVRDRAVFAHGALEAAKWLKGRSGWFSIDDMIGK
jgi:4-hydroxy-tetrahydrodipicolinate reductase